jgi:hypothetical protein
MSVTLAAGQNAAQVAGTGSILSIGGPVGTTPSWLTVGAVADFATAGRKRSVVQSTTFDSLGIVQKLGTTLDLGTATFTVERVSNDAGQLACVAANVAGGSYQFELQLPINSLIGQVTKGDLILFSGIVTEGGNFNVDIDKVSQFKFTVDLIAYSVTAGS